MLAFEWPIEDVEAAHPGLYLEHHAIMAVALMSRHSAPPYEFLVECEGFCPNHLEGEKQFMVGVSWGERMARASERIWRTEQPKPIVERAAVALAALVFPHLLPDSRLRVTTVGDRADYWLPRLRCGLEISGTEHERELARRQREKKKQLLANSRGWDGYVFVCRFGPGRGQIRWSYHTQEEQENATL